MMKFKSLIPLLMVPLVAGMGSRPEGQGSNFQRGTVGVESAPVTEKEAQVLSILPAAEADPQEFTWQARPLVIFADTGADPAFLDQLKALERDPAPLLARDVVVITDTDPAANSIWRRQLRPEGFSLVLMDKDGQVKLRKPLPWTVREISRAIDKFPLRLQEINREDLGD